MGSSRVARCRSTGRRRARGGGTRSGVAPSATTGDVTGCREGSRHTTAETWATTSTMTPVVTRGLGGHEVSKPSMTDARWSAERIGPKSSPPRIVAGPGRGGLGCGRRRVLDGAIRDLWDVRRMGLTVYARSKSPRTAVGHYATVAKNVPSSAPA